MESWLEQIERETIASEDDYLQLVRLEKRKRQLQEQLEAAQKEYNSLSHKILNLGHGDSVKIGNATIYHKEEFIVLPKKDTDYCCQALLDSGFEDCVINCIDDSQLRREFRKLGFVPMDLQDCFKIWKKNNLIVRFNRS